MGTSGNNQRSDETAYCSWSRCDLKNITKIDFSYNRYSELITLIDGNVALVYSNSCQNALGWIVKLL